MPFLLSKVNSGILFLIILTIKACDSDMDFTYSAGDLYRLTETERQVSKRLQEMEDTMASFLQQVQMLRQSAINHSAEEIIKNPLLSYQLVKRHVEHLTKFDESLKTLTSGMNGPYMKLRNTFIKPTKSDIGNAMEAIIRLRQTYNLSVSEFSQGKIGKREIDGSLSAEDLIEIGLFARESGMNVNAKLFLETGLRQLEFKNISQTERFADLIMKAEDALESLSQLSMKADWEDFRVLTEMNVIFATDSLENLNKGFEHLCQLHAVKEPPISNLKCYLDKSSSPVRKLSPLKIEVFHENPQVIVIYDFMTDSEIDAIESATFFKLKRSLTQVYLPGGKLQTEKSIIRTTSQTWIYDLNHPQFGYLSKRIESWTGYFLSGKNSAEELQIASYRPGGHYSLHTDATQEDLLKPLLGPEDIIQGDRLVTFMVYLSDVESGGNTVFPMLNVSVKPVKGSAIIWGNLHIDSSIDRRTLHGACPVLHGIKNIATKWIRANDQMFTRHKCKPDKSLNHFNLQG